MASSSATESATRRRSPPAASSPPATTPPEVSVKLEFIEEMTTNVDAVQERVLGEILGRNAESEYHAKCGLTAGGATDRATFRAKVPMVTYEDLKPYIMRVADGDRSPVLSGSAHPVSEFFSSSGTSGGQLKLIPSVKDELDRRQLLYSLIMPVMSQFVPGVDKGKGLYFLFVRPETKTASGLPARPVLTSYYKSEHFKNSHGRRHTYYTSPMAAILCEDTFQSMYAQMVCGLRQRGDVVRVGAAFAAGLLRAILFLQQHWEQLAADIDAGELGPASVVTDPSVRAAVAGILRAPDPELALAIRAECAKGDWAGIVARVWPNAKYLDTIVTGSMAQYVPALNYYGGGLPIASTRYVASECPIGLNLRGPTCEPSEVSYTIMPNMAYFEFLPVDAADGTRAAAACELVELAGVEAGREYELVVTTYGGLSRYRVGDVLRVTGFHNAAPQFRFARREGVLLSVDADKTDEAELQRAVERASSALLRPRGAAVLDYTSRTCADSIPGHYVVYWELLLLATTKKGKPYRGPQTTRTTSDDDDMDGDDDDVLSRCCLEMEEALSYVYRVLRVKDGTIGPLEIRVVRPGTFQDLADYSVSHGGASMGQYKVPRSVTAVPGIVQLLDSRVVSRHFSPALPRWPPVQHLL